MACLIALFLSAGLSLGASGARIEKIQFETPSASEDRVTFQLNGAHLPKMFALKGDRPRVVFDFTNTFPTKSVKNSIKADGAFIKQVRSGIHRGDKPKTRIVFDLKSGQDVDFKQDFDKETNTLVIRVFAVGTELEPLTAEQAEPASEQEPAKVAAAPEEAAPEVQPAEVKPEPAPEPEPKETVAETTPAEEAKPEPEQQVASIPEKETPAPETTEEESTVIQPLSEIGDVDAKAAAEPSAPILYSIEFDDNSNRGEMILFKMNEFYPPVVFGIEEDIPRIVCFFKGTQAGSELEDLIESNGQHVKAIRVGKYQNPDNIRVVLDLVPDKNYDLQQIFFKDDNLFMIIINTTGDKASG